MLLIRHSAWAAAAAIVLAASRVALAAVIARRFSIEVFGQFAYAQWLVDLAFLVCSFGLTGVAGRYLAEYRHDSGLLAAFFKRWRPFALGLPILAGVAALAGMWISGMALSPSAAAMLALWTIASGLWAMQTAALSGLQRFDLIFLANAIGATIMVAGAFLISMDGREPGALFGLMATAAGVAMLVGLRQTVGVAASRPAAIDVSRWRSIRYYAMNMWLTSLLWSLVWSRGEMPIVRESMGDIGVAHYAAALTLFGGAIQGVMLAVSGVAPQLTRMWGEGLHEQAVLLARNLLDMQLLVSGLAAVLLICLSPELMWLVFGAGFRDQSGTLVILSLGLLSMAVACQNHLLQIATDARFNRNSTLLGLLVLLASAAWLVSVAGLHGAALARAATMLLMATVSLFMVRKKWGSAAYSAWNLASVFVLVASSAGVVLWMPEAHWTLRAGLAGIAIVLATVAVRDIDGRMLAGVVCHRIGHVLVARAPLRKKVTRS